ncbi:HlyD family secretion protein [Phyllobacterium zundukense]|uniref:HlyD family secretion protein n=1 Tax=Phyllobacterium zundukense TaxID=1867719 RepID=A0ACD4CY43_9HYPH|nr:HlyD family secretion protein [Phyllobacterium zundukense]UXN58486.1 HlyD family secretion protein [Phyllobacterium zundukense]
MTSGETSTQNDEQAAVDLATTRSAVGSSKKGRLIRIGLLCLVVPVVAAAGTYFVINYVSVGRFLVSTDDAYIQADVVPIAPQVEGYIREVLVTDNQAVKSGQLLAKLDDRTYRAAVDQAIAAVAEAQASITDIEARLDQQQSAIQEAGATTNVDKATETFDSQNDQRYGTLATSGYGNEQNAQQAHAQDQAAKSTIIRDEAALLVAQKQVATLNAELGKANAVLAQTKAAQDQAELNLGYTVITSPIAGVVGERTLRPGEFVQPGTGLMAIVPLESTYIVANFEETQLSDVRVGQTVTARIDTFPDARIVGYVDSMAPASGEEFALLPPDNATGNFTKIVQRIPVRITLDRSNPLAGRLKPGMSVTATIDTRTTPTTTESAGQSPNHTVP